VPCSEDSDISTHCRSHCLWPQSASQAEPHFCSRVMSHPQGHICELGQATTRVEWLETALGPHEGESPGAKDQDSHDGDEEDCDKGDDTGEGGEAKLAGGVRDSVWCDTSSRARGRE